MRGIYRTPCEAAPEMWFSEDYAEREAAKRLCRTACTVRQQCYELALTSPKPTHGVWGGHSIRTINRLEVAA